MFSRESSSIGIELKSIDAVAGETVAFSILWPGGEERFNTEDTEIGAESTEKTRAGPS
jgi:hypothetical protein